MSTKDKPNTEFDAPENKPTAEELYSDPGERLVFGTHGGMAGFWRLVIPLVVFLLVAGAFFAFVS
jgi:phage shock protein PspC (stress-responsive transcriptional regulator)